MIFYYKKDEYKKLKIAYNELVDKYLNKEITIRRLKAKIEKLENIIFLNNIEKGEN